MLASHFVDKPPLQTHVHDALEGSLMVWHLDLFVRACEFVHTAPACRVVFLEWIEKPQFVLVRVWILSPKGTDLLMFVLFMNVIRF